MKKFLIFVLTAIFSLSLCSCAFIQGGNVSESASSSESSKAPVEIKPYDDQGKYDAI